MRRVAVGGLALLAAVTSCGVPSPTRVTCGEFAAMSTEERRAVVRDVARANDTEEQLAALGEGDRGADLAALGIVQQCGTQSDRTIAEVFDPTTPTPAPTG